VFRRGRACTGKEVKEHHNITGYMFLLDFEGLIQMTIDSALSNCFFKGFRGKKI